jgi:uncharacterized surface protein with fasciclin (FAS1) repeats
MKAFLLLLVISFALCLAEARGKKGKSKHSSSSSSENLDSILEIAELNYTTLASALVIADLDYTYDCSKRCRDVTFFAPSNEAFLALDSSTLAKLTQDPMYKEHLVQLLEYHVVRNELESTDINNGAQYRTIQGENISATVSGSTILLNGAATVSPADRKASNGILHEINAVLLPTF